MKRIGWVTRGIRGSLGLLCAGLAAASLAASPTPEQQEWSDKYPGHEKVPAAPVAILGDVIQRDNPVEPELPEGGTPRLSIETVRTDAAVRSTDFRLLRPQAAELAEVDAAMALGNPRVIVTLALSFTPEGLFEPAHADAQRAVMRAAQDSVIGALSAIGVTVDRRFETVPMLALEATPAAIQLLKRLPGIARIEVDSFSSPQLGTSVPRIGAADVHDRGVSGLGWVVAVIDTGIDRAHPFLAGFVGEACFTTTHACPDGSNSQTSEGAGERCLYPGCFHGTHVAGIATGVGQGALRGVAKRAQLMPIRAADPNPDTGEPIFYESALIAALEYVYSQRNSYAIAAVNMSLGDEKANYDFCDTDARKPIIDNLRAAGIATVIASGNEGHSRAVSAPGCISSAITVAAAGDTDDYVPYFSNYGSQVDVVAPGEDINSSVPGGGYAELSGTSMAAPHVAGAFALLQQRAQTTVGVNEGRLESTGKNITDTRGGVQGLNTKPRINVFGAAALDYPLLRNDLAGNYREPRPLLHNFLWNSTAVFWSAVATRETTSDLDVDLRVYDTETGQTLLGSSAVPKGRVDLVALNRNLRAADPIYPRVNPYSTGPNPFIDGRYLIELSDATKTLSFQETSSMDINDVVRIWDKSTSAGLPLAVRVVPASTLDADLFVFTSDPANPSTFVRGRSSATATSAAAGPGIAEGVKFTPAMTGYAGVAVTSANGFGAFTVYADISAPSGSLVIDGGTSTTVDATVSLALNAADAQTGVEKMRISIDGTLDAEPWTPYAPTKTVVLPSGLGVKTVRAQYRNFAGLDSAVFSDTIKQVAASVRVDVRDLSMPEGTGLGTTFRVPVTLSAAIPNADVLVDLSTADGSATVSGRDYTARTATLRIPAGTTQATFDVSVSADNKVERPETFRVRIINRIQNAVAGDGEATVTISNDDR